VVDVEADRNFVKKDYSSLRSKIDPFLQAEDIENGQKFLTLDLLIL